MKVSLQWLSEFFDVNFLKKDVIEAFLYLGFEIHSIDNDILELSLASKRLDCEFLFGILHELRFFFKKKSVKKKAFFLV